MGPQFSGEVARATASTAVTPGQEGSDAQAVFCSVVFPLGEEG